jgi:hypothetical protein
VLSEGDVLLVRAADADDGGAEHESDEGSGGPDEDRPTGAAPRVVVPVPAGAFENVEPRRSDDEASPEPAEPLPAVPPQGHSPEDAASS